MGVLLGRGGVRDKMSKRKADISINMIMVIVISIISIVMLLGIFSTKLPTFAKSIYCKTFFYVHSATFVPKEIRQDQSFCRDTKAMNPPVTLSNETTLNITLLGYMTACWKQAEYGQYANNLICYELVIGPRIETPAVITEREVTEILIQNNICDVFANNDVPGTTCGDRNDIEWGIVDDTIQTEQNLLVEYVDHKIKIS
jgi:hypothetical protein